MWKMEKYNEMVSHANGKESFRVANTSMISTPDVHLDGGGFRLGGGGGARAAPRRCRAP